jgi:hypothetical protein
MRKILALLCLCIPLHSFCQIEKPVSRGNAIISGGGSIEYTKSVQGVNKTSTHNFNFNPGFGYFIIDNLAVGVNTTFGIEKLSVKYYTYGIGPYAKYYFNNGLFLQTETFYSSTKAVGSITHKSTVLTIAPGIGYAIFLNSKISLEPSLNYRYNNYKSDYNDGGDIKANTIFFGLKLNLFL